jgi:hypothetical protein
MLIRSEATAMKNTEQPVTTPSEHREGDTQTRHPAFAQISLTRRSGREYLYGSDFEHQHSICLTVQPSTLHRSLSDDRHMPDLHHLIEVSMSEAQWAHMISSIGQSGTPCTLQTLDGKTIPRLPPPPSRTEQFAKESSLRLERACEALANAVAMVQSSKLSKVEKSNLTSKINAALNDIGSNQQFVADMFDEHMEKTVLAARIEINNYAQQRDERGQGALAGAVLSLPAKSSLED